MELIMHKHYLRIMQYTEFEHFHKLTKNELKKLAHILIKY